MAGSFAKMDEANRAMCYALRNPPAGMKKASLKAIAGMVEKTDGSHPSTQTVSEAAKQFKVEKAKRGRRKGDRKTTAAEDRAILKKFKVLRPPGHGIDSRKLHRALPVAIRRKVSRKTVIRRLADKGIKPREKIRKSDHSVALCKRRVDFALRYQHKSDADWSRDLQAVGDIKVFTYYPAELKPRFKRLQSRWTYMTEEERHQSAFMRPKRWWTPKEYRMTKQQKVFGFTTSTGQRLSFLVPQPWSTELWAVELRNRVIPFLRSAFPGRRSFQVLLDGEAILHGPEARFAMSEAGIKVLPGWPSYSPDLNPQENVWGWAEKKLRTIEHDNDTFGQFQIRVMQAVDAYPVESAVKLVPTIGKRLKELIEKKGAALKY
jgi:transposase